MKRIIKVADLQNARGKETPREYKVTDYDYEKFETYVHTSRMSLFSVKAVGKLHFNVICGSGEVERCNRLIVLKSIGCYDDIVFYVYLCGHNALNPPEVGQIVDAQLQFIYSDPESGITERKEYYWADSITPISENVEINYEEFEDDY